MRAHDELPVVGCNCTGCFRLRNGADPIPPSVDLSKPLQVRIEIDWAHTHAVEAKVTGYSHEPINGGERFTGPSGLTYDLITPKIHPQVALMVTRPEERKWLYEATVLNEAPVVRKNSVHRFSAQLQHCYIVTS
jgi:hypothetical protein